METKLPYFASIHPSENEPLAADIKAFLSDVEALQREASRLLPEAERAKKGQYFTPSLVAQQMAAYVQINAPIIRLLDAGAGVGSLFAAMVAEFCKHSHPPQSLHVTAFEIDPLLIRYLKQTRDLCAVLCEKAGITFNLDICNTDFIATASQWGNQGLFATESPNFDIAILNPPYGKIRTGSPERRFLHDAGIETTNLYTGFLALAIRSLAPDGALIAITPRSFCNGTYFRPFRQQFLETMCLHDIHLFPSRDNTFREDDVLQETIIVHATKNSTPPDTIRITCGEVADGDAVLFTERSYQTVVRPDDPEQFIRISADEGSEHVEKRMASFTASLTDLGLKVSTGRVVDFRATAFLRQQPASDTVPLLYPANLIDGSVQWPLNTRKPQALIAGKSTETLLIPNETYVLVKRFSAKEERRRLVASLYEEGMLSGDAIGIENHLNYFHAEGRGIDRDLAQGLVLYLNSTLIDAFFRQFSGHTQVNATDLRNFRYPTATDLRRLSVAAGAGPHSQETIDRLIRETFFAMANDNSADPALIQKRIEEAQTVLRLLEFPKAQCNERSALTLLALLDLRPSLSWQDATHPTRTIHEMMTFMRQEYGKSYAENSRETIRRQTLHQFVDAGLVLANADDPTRPINSGKFSYRISPDALTLLQAFGTTTWDADLASYLASNFTLRERYAQERYQSRIPVHLPENVVISLSPGGQNLLIKEVIEQFAPRYTPGGQVLYIGDADAKFLHFDHESLTSLGVKIEEHGKMPDIILYHAEKNWLVVIEAVTSHGPIHPKRKIELETLLSTSTAGLVFVTAFLTRVAMRPYLPEIAWETDVWTADAPDHLIHFNGERFLGPYLSPERTQS